MDLPVSKALHTGPCKSYTDTFFEASNVFMRVYIGKSR
jgi:hypothetical protein